MAVTFFTMSTFSFSFFLFELTSLSNAPSALHVSDLASSQAKQSVGADFVGIRESTSMRKEFKNWTTMPSANPTSSSKEVEQTNSSSQGHRLKRTVGQAEEAEKLRKRLKTVCDDTITSLRNQVKRGDVNCDCSTLIESRHKLNQTKCVAEASAIILGEDPENNYDFQQQKIYASAPMANRELYKQHIVYSFDLSGICAPGALCDMANEAIKPFRHAFWMAVSLISPLNKNEGKRLELQKHCETLDPLGTAQNITSASNHSMTTRLAVIQAWIAIDRHLATINSVSKWCESTGILNATLRSSCKLAKLHRDQKLEEYEWAFAKIRCGTSNTAGTSDGQEIEGMPTSAASGTAGTSD